MGKRNHKYFLSFLIAVVVHSFFTMITGIIVVQELYNGEISKDYIANYPAWVTMIFAGFILLSLFPFSIYHSYLAGRGRTTNEE